jgi:hypothetical protein
MANAAAQNSTEQLLHLKLAFLAGEPPSCVLTLARYAPPLPVKFATVPRDLSLWGALFRVIRD